MNFVQSEFRQTPQPDGGELASQLVSLFSITVLTSLFGIKTFNVQFKYLSYSRWLILILYVLSWAFTATGLVLVSTNNGDFTSCFLSEMACDIFYSGTKIVIYTWLIEKVWVVSSVRQSRWETKSYRFHMALMAPYPIIFTLMIIFHIAELEEDGMCYIGLRPIASIPLLVYDFIFNLYMTTLFVKPLMKIGKSINLDWRTSRLHDVARRTLVASIVSLLVSFANILAVTILNGRERGVLCLTCCTVDVTINVVTIHWVTSSRTAKITKEATLNQQHPSLADEMFDPPMGGKQQAVAKGHFGQPHQFGFDEDQPIPSYTSHNTSLHPPNQANQQHRYVNGRFVMITDHDDTVASSRTPSFQESHCSSKSLTKNTKNNVS